MQELGDYLRYLRKGRLNLTLKNLSELLFISDEYIRLIEKEKKKMPEDYPYRLKKLFPDRVNEKDLEIIENYYIEERINYLKNKLIEQKQVVLGE